MFKRWFVSERDLPYLDPVKARDVIIRCFYSAQKETFARVKEKVNQAASDQEIKHTITAAVKSVFTTVGEDFDNPSPEGLVKVVSILASKAKSWGTPDDIIEHHKEQIKKVLDALQKTG